MTIYSSIRVDEVVIEMPTVNFLCCQWVRERKKIMNVAFPRKLKFSRNYYILF